MAIIGFNFLKVTCEKKDQVKGEVKVKYNVKIRDIVPAEITLGTNKQKGARFIFEHITTYEGGIGDISLIGEILWVEKDEKVDAAINTWKAKKPLDISIMGPMMNMIWSKCMIQAVVMSKEVNLPAPMPMPKLSIGPKPTAPAEAPKKEDKKAQAKK